MPECMWGASFRWSDSDDLPEEVTFEQRTKWSEGGTHSNIWWKSGPGRGKSKDNSPEAGMCLVCWRNDKEAGWLEPGECRRQQREMRSQRSPGLRVILTFKLPQVQLYLVSVAHLGFSDRYERLTSPFPLWPRAVDRCQFWSILILWDDEGSLEFWTISGLLALETELGISSHKFREAVGQVEGCPDHFNTNSLCQDYHRAASLVIL